MAELAFHHHAIGVRDLERAEAFYTGVLGLSVTRRWSDDQGHPRSIWLGLGDGFVALERMDSAGKGDGGSGHHCFAFQIDPSARQAWRERLELAGVRIERETDHTMYVRDPDGALIGLSHWPEAVNQPTSDG